MNEATKQTLILGNDALNKLDEAATQCLHALEKYGDNDPDEKSDYFSGILIQTYHHIINLKEAFATELNRFIIEERENK